MNPLVSCSRGPVQHSAAAMLQSASISLLVPNDTQRWLPMYSLKVLLSGRCSHALAFRSPGEMRKSGQNTTGRHSELSRPPPQLPVVNCREGLRLRDCRKTTARYVRQFCRSFLKSTSPSFQDKGSFNASCKCRLICLTLEDDPCKCEKSVPTASNSCVLKLHSRG